MQRKQQEQRKECTQPQQDPECKHGAPPVCRCFLSDPQIWFYYNAAARFLQAGIENGCAGKEKNRMELREFLGEMVEESAEQTGEK